MSHSIKVLKKEPLATALIWLRENSTVTDEDMINIKIRNTSMWLAADFTYDLLFRYLEIPALPRESWQRVIELAILDFKKNDVPNDANVIKRFDESVRSVLSQVNNFPNKYSVFTLVNIDPNSNLCLQEIKVRNESVVIAEKHELTSMLLDYIDTLPKVSKQNDRQLVNGKRLFPIVININAYDKDVAFKMGTYYLDIVVALIDYIFCMTTYTVYNFIQPDIPVSQIFYSRAIGILAIEQTVFNGATITTSDDLLNQRKLLKLDDQKAGLMQKMLDIINTENDLADLFIEVIMVYSNAMQETNRRTGYLLLWQVLEKIALDNPKEDDHTLTRIRNLLNLQTSTFEYQLLVLVRDMRNGFVHGSIGHLQDRMRDLFFALKWFVDRAIWQFLKVCETYSSRTELDHWYSYSTVSDEAITNEITALEVKAKSLVKVMESRRKK